MKKNNLDHENIRKYGLACRVNFTPPLVHSVTPNPLVQQGLNGEKTCDMQKK